MKLKLHYLKGKINLNIRSLNTKNLIKKCKKSLRNLIINPRLDMILTHHNQ